MGIFQKLGQGGTGPGRDDIEGVTRQILHPCVFYCDVQGHALCGGLQEGTSFRVEVIDTWNMTITPVNDVFVVRKKPSTGIAADNYAFEDKDGRSVPLPGKPYIALRIRLQE